MRLCALLCLSRIIPWILQDRGIFVFNDIITKANPTLFHGQ